MTAKIIPISPYITLGKIDECVDHLLSYAIRHQDETTMQHVARLKALNEELYRGIQAQQRQQTVKMLEDSIAFRRQR